MLKYLSKRKIDIAHGPFSTEIPDLGRISVISICQTLLLYLMIGEKEIPEC